jgi:hypothetical protein
MQLANRCSAEPLEPAIDELRLLALINGGEGPRHLPFIVVPGSLTLTLAPSSPSP